MRISLVGLAWMSTVATAALAAAEPAAFNEAAFEQRFKAADKGNTGKLSRAQAYAAFPQMPEFFAEIDTNKDDFITLLEVSNAMERRVNAAIDESRPESGYAAATELKDGGGPGLADAASSGQSFSSSAEARRYHRYQYYESLAADSQESAINRGVIAPAAPLKALPAAPMQFDKAF
jgi:hypothetical protein